MFKAKMPVAVVDFLERSIRIYKYRAMSLDILSGSSSFRMMPFRTAIAISCLTFPAVQWSY